MKHCKNCVYYRPDDLKGHEETFSKCTKTGYFCKVERSESSWLVNFFMRWCGKSGRYYKEVQ